MHARHWCTSVSIQKTELASPYKNMIKLPPTSLAIWAVLVLATYEVQAGVLQVTPSPTRDVISLDGLWYFTINGSHVDSIEESEDQEINLMPVPSSYNDISTKLDVRDHAGAVWYKRSFFVPSSWKNKKVWIRFGSVCYNATVSINGEVAAEHEIGHLPFAAEVSQFLKLGEDNDILVEVNNILTNTTIPQGELNTLISGRKKVSYTFDFFNYAGIDRPVYLYTTNEIYIDDIDIHTNLNGSDGLINYNVAVVGGDSTLKYEINILDNKGKVAGTSSSQSSTLNINNATLWWPYLMAKNPGYLYTFEVFIRSKDDVLLDYYKQRFGIRVLEYTNTTFTINGKNIYMRGFGKHEDSDIRGKGLDLPTILRDFNLIRWIGANSFRTSHYPYADEIMDLADQFGIMVIDEVPAVNTQDYNKELLENHKRSLTELHKRDKNRPSVVLWSIANEPVIGEPVSEDYYRQIKAHIKSLDTSRPITLANSYTYDTEYAAQFVDILGVNRYEAWYHQVGEIDGIYPRVLEQAKGWHTKFNKPVIYTEYGADSKEGLSYLPTFIWSEEYQNDLITEYFKAFDELRDDQGWLVGEMIWCFADFRTDQDIRRLGGNKKGLFTRSRQPKQAAFRMRKRYWELAHNLNNATLPADLDPYIVSFTSSKNVNFKDEL
ncbi:beta-glucuronidase-like isoform X2 [Euwallacea fornicatus]|uniref:beta-glucuronidase-like isoform X2 n=1 Tax=Euwallacea fornicatus TaxID=995702 RepID=UPI00338DFF01